MDDAQKKKYKKLYNSLKRIRTNLNSLNNFYDDVYLEIKNTVTIDSDIPKQDELKNVCNSVNSVYKEISNNIIPRVKNKIY